MADIHVLTSYLDVRRAQQLQSFLSRSGWVVTRSQQGRQPNAGEAADNVAVNTARCILALCSRHANESYSFRAAVARAAERGVVVLASLDGSVAPLRDRRQPLPLSPGWDGRSDIPDVSEITRAVKLLIDPPRTKEDAAAPQAPRNSRSKPAAKPRAETYGEVPLTANQCLYPRRLARWVHHLGDQVKKGERLFLLEPVDSSAPAHTRETGTAPINGYLSARAVEPGEAVPNYMVVGVVTKRKPRGVYQAPRKSTSQKAAKTALTKPSTLLPVSTPKLDARAAARDTTAAERQSSDAKRQPSAAPSKNDSARSQQDPGKNLTAAATSPTPAPSESPSNDNSATIQLKNRIFICYRREDTQDAAGRLYDRLTADYGPGTIFMDIDSVPLGIDFVSHATEQVARCAVVIVMVGKQWLRIKDKRRRRRLDNDDDLVRAEVRAALQQQIHVIPVFVQNAEMPSADDLPEDIRALSRRNGVHLRPEQWKEGVERLLRELNKHMRV